MNTQNTPRAVQFLDEKSRYFEITADDGETYTGRIYESSDERRGPSIDWDTAPDDWEKAEDLILKAYARKEKEKSQSPDLTAYLETYFEISAYLMATIERPGKIAHDTHEAQGRGGLYEVAKALTEKFEKQNAGKLWDGDFFEEIDKFINQAEAEHRQNAKK
jgi:hypothetical protein